MTQTNEKNDAVDLVVRTWRERVGFGPNFPLHSPSAVERAMEAEIAELRAQAAALTNNQIAAGAAVLCDHGRPIGRNAAIEVADAMRLGAQPVAPVQVSDERRVDDIVTALYRRFKDWNKRGFGPDDVTWCEVKADVVALTGLAAPSSQIAEVASGETNAAKAAYWLLTLEKCHRLLKLPDDEPVPSGVLRAVVEIAKGRQAERASETN